MLSHLPPSSHFLGDGLGYLASTPQEVYVVPFPAASDSGKDPSKGQGLLCAGTSTFANTRAPGSSDTSCLMGSW